MEIGCSKAFSSSWTHFLLQESIFKKNSVKIIERIDTWKFFIWFCWASAIFFVSKDCIFCPFLTVFEKLNNPCYFSQVPFFWDNNFLLKEIVPIKDLRDQDYFRYNMSNAPPQNGARLDQQVSYLFSTFKKSFLFSTGDSLTIHSSVNFIRPKNLFKKCTFIFNFIEVVWSVLS